MPSQYQQEMEATRPEWYRLVLACLRGEIPLSAVPDEHRYLCVQWRPSDRRHTPSDSELPHNGGWTNIEASPVPMGDLAPRVVPLPPPEKPTKHKAKPERKGIEL